ncbi:substrate-binding domain-containing protein [Neobacillus vireti]|uniref:substrate-binding domain-containing protein n=1 Tax=Neobacillus vireti TaxID=220686 RepID=UPI0009E1FCD4|nr:substrate-binding domain-containing protein [Neobacillus vireti]
MFKLSLYNPIDYTIENPGSGLIGWCLTPKRGKASIDLPIVVVGSYLEESPFPCVRPDDTDGTKQAVKSTVPKDISVVGVDDDPILEYITPSLSTVHVDLLGIGKKATSILMDMLTGKQIRKKDVVFKMEYINRSTTFTPRE